MQNCRSWESGYQLELEDVFRCEVSSRSLIADNCPERLIFYLLSYGILIGKELFCQSFVDNCNRCFVDDISSGKYSGRRDVYLRRPTVAISWRISDWVFL